MSHLKIDNDIFFFLFSMFRTTTNSNTICHVSFLEYLAVLLSAVVFNKKNLDDFILHTYFVRMKTNIIRGDVCDISAKTETLVVLYVN